MVCQWSNRRREKKEREEKENKRKDSGDRARAIPRIPRIAQVRCDYRLYKRHTIRKGALGSSCSCSCTSSLCVSCCVVGVNVNGIAVHSSKQPLGNSHSSKIPLPDLFLLRLLSWSAADNYLGTVHCSQGTYSLQE